MPPKLWPRRWIFSNSIPSLQLSSTCVYSSTIFSSFELNGGLELLPKPGKSMASTVLSLLSSGMFKANMASPAPMPCTITKGGLERDGVGPCQRFVHTLTSVLPHPGNQPVLKILSEHFPSLELEISE